VTIFFVLCHSGQLIGLNLYTLHLAVDPVTFMWQAGNGKHVPFALIAAFQIAGLCPEILTFETNIKVRDDLSLYHVALFGDLSN
jgi:hypothetical protein